MYTRVLLDRLKKRVDFKKAIILYGSRQVGKTTLVRQLAKDLALPFEYFNADDLITRNLWSQQNMANLRASFGSAKVVILDEAQMIQDIGILIKQLIDLQTGIQFILTGSSSFDIANKTQEPLTGRKWEFLLYPVGFSEIVQTDGMAEAMRKMPFNLIFGGYPDVVSNPSDAVDLIRLLSNSYLYKDVLALSGIQKPQALQRILQALAYQVGGEVSLNEISRLVGVDVKTVDNYMYLLEQIFVVFRLPVLSRNERNELNSKSKIYFYDNGVLNALTGNFAPPEGRQDIGALWENYLISERKKLLDYHGFFGKTYFWRNSLQAEIDYVEVIDGKVYGYEFKWNPKAKKRYPKNFIDIYNPELTETIHKDNYMNWLINYPY